MIIAGLVGDRAPASANRSADQRTLTAAKQAADYSSAHRRANYDLRSRMVAMVAPTLRLYRMAMPPVRG